MGGRPGGGGGGGGEEAKEEEEEEEQEGGVGGGRHLGPQSVQSCPKTQNLSPSGMPGTEEGPAPSSQTPLFARSTPEIMVHSSVQKQPFAST